MISTDCKDWMTMLAAVEVWTISDVRPPILTTITNTYEGILPLKSTNSSIRRFLRLFCLPLIPPLHHRPTCHQLRRQISLADLTIITIIIIIIIIQLATCTKLRRKFCISNSNRSSMACRSKTMSPNAAVQQSGRISRVVFKG